MLDFRVETFLTVCRYMNFTKAAEALNITQPAVSHHIRYLEEQYQAKLFDYIGKKIILTESGKILLSAAATMKHDELHLKKIIRQQREERRKLVFGATMTIGEYKMPDALKRLIEHLPSCTVNMIVADTKELLDKLNRGEIEFAIVEGFFQKKEYDSLVYDKERFVAVCSFDYKLHTNIQKIEDLIEERLLIREKGSGTRFILERYLEENNLLIQDFPNRMEISNIGAIKKMTEQGIGITFLYETAVKKELGEKRLMEIKFEDFQLFHDFTFIWQKDSIYSDYYKKIFEILKVT